MLTDVMSSLKLDVFPTIGMICFLAAFFAITIRALRSPAQDMQEAAQVPLTDEPPHSSQGA
jgi:hypothetical protein